MDIEVVTRLDQLMAGDSSRPGPADARLTQFGVPVWNVVAF